MPATAREQAGLLGLPLPDEAALTSDPALNVRLGAAYLRRMLDAFEGDEVFALAAYHAGAARVKRWREAAPDLDARGVIAREGGPQTRGYIPRVLSFRDAYRAAR
jgi:soluble lytic murein transglycosylase